MVSRRLFLIAQATFAGAPVLMAYEAVASTALSRPDLDMEEDRPWDEWEKEYGPVAKTR